MKRAIALVAAAFLAWGARAAPFADPTQPPSLQDGADERAARSGPLVESILIAPDRRLAIVDGQQVTVGGRVGAGAVVRITETEVVVRGPEGDLSLRLFPDIGRGAAAPAKKGTSK